MAIISSNQVTRMGLSGAMFRPVGSFAEKAIAQDALEEVATGGWWYAYDNTAPRSRIKKKLVKARTSEGAVDRELIRLLREQEEDLDRVKELRRLSKMTLAHQEALALADKQKRLLAAAERKKKGRERAMRREEEIFLIQATKLIMNSGSK